MVRHPLGLQAGAISMILGGSAARPNAQGPEPREPLVMPMLTCSSGVSLDWSRVLPCLKPRRWQEGRGQSFQRVERP